MATSKYAISAAIDFGTAYSGYAYSLASDPKRIYINEVWSKARMSLKTPTAVLIDSHGDFHSFGYDAVETYYEKLQENVANGWALFRKFKMNLHQHEWDSSAEFMLSDTTSRIQKPALNIFAMAIRYLKDHVIKQVKDALGYSENNILFVITVPAIWDDRSKAFMRDAAREAGIADDQLKMSLESEAASIWWHSMDNHKSIQKEGTQSMIIDIGGGAADITVHETMATGKLAEVDTSKGGNWGGSTVDKSFISKITQVIGEKALKQFGSECMEDLFDLLRDLEVKKNTVKSTLNGYFTIRMPPFLMNIGKNESLSKLSSSPAELIRTLQAKTESDGLFIKDDKMRIAASIAKEMFSYPTENLTRHVKDLLKQKSLKKVDKIIVVGGFSECEQIQEALEDLRKTAFPDKSFVFPEDAGLATLKGAVLYGHEPSIISARKAKFSYGIKKVMPFNESEDPLNERKNVKGKWVCERFVKLIGVNDTIPFGHVVKDSSKLVDESQKQITICLYTSNYPDTKYISEPTCRELKKITARVPKANPGEERTVETWLIVDDTEMKVKIKHLPSGEMTVMYLSFV